MWRSKRKVRAVPCVTNAKRRGRSAHHQISIATGVLLRTSRVCRAANYSAISRIVTASMSALGPLRFAPPLMFSAYGWPARKRFRCSPHARLLVGVASSASVSARALGQKSQKFQGKARVVAEFLLGHTIGQGADLRHSGDKRLLFAWFVRRCALCLPTKLSGCRRGRSSGRTRLWLCPRGLVCGRREPAGSGDWGLAA